MGEVDNVRIGGVLRCCLASLADLYPDGPARIAAEGDTHQCKFAPNDPSHRLRFKSGAWEWDHD